MEYEFIYDERLGIHVPSLYNDWEQYNDEIQSKILTDWEDIRGKIPDRIFDLEQLINAKQAKLNNEENFQVSCQLNSEIAELASIINDLWLWFRSSESITIGKAHQ